MKHIKANFFHPERYGTLLLALALTATIFVLTQKPWDISFGDFLGEMIATYTTICSVMVGFLAASLSSFMTHSSNRLVKILKDSGFYEKIINFANNAMHINSFSICVAFILLLLFKRYSTSNWTYFIFICWIFLASCGFFSFWRIISILTLAAKKSNQI